MAEMVSAGAGGESKMTEAERQSVINANVTMALKSKEFYAKVRAAGYEFVVEGQTSNFRNCIWFTVLAQKAGTAARLNLMLVRISNAREAELTNSIVPTSTIEAGVRHVIPSGNVKIGYNLQGSSQWVPSPDVVIPEDVCKSVSLKPFFPMTQPDYERFCALVDQYHTTPSREVVEALANFMVSGKSFDAHALLHAVTACVTAHKDHGENVLVLANAGGKGLDPAVGACLGPIPVHQITRKGWGAAAFHYLVCKVAEPMGIAVVNLARGEGEELFPLPSMPPQSPLFADEYPDADAFVDRGGGRLALVYKDGRSGFRSASYAEESGVIEAMFKLYPEETQRVCKETVSQLERLLAEAAAAPTEDA
jgi:hypothetical protein